jgi:hypothetical protein
MSSARRPHPRSVFGVDEDRQLSRAVADLGTDSWSAVAARVAGRNPRQCRDRWRNYLAPNIDNGPWTAAEEELLIAKQAEFGAAWKAISRFFPRRGMRARRHSTNLPSLRPMAKTSRPHPRNVFSAEEDSQLAQVVGELGTNSWEAVAAFVAGRNPRQCRDRWRNYLAPNVGNGPWTPAEEELLIAKQAELGCAWTQIARFFRSRTDINIKSRWHQIQRRWRRAAADDRQSSPAAEAPQKPETVFDEIWKGRMEADEAEAGIFSGCWY